MSVFISKIFNIFSSNKEKKEFFLYNFDVENINKKIFTIYDFIEKNSEKTYFSLGEMRDILIKINKILLGMEPVLLSKKLIQCSGENDIKIKKYDKYFTEEDCLHTFIRLENNVYIDPKNIHKDIPRNIDFNNNCLYLRMKIYVMKNQPFIKCFSAEKLNTYGVVLIIANFGSELLTTLKGGRNSFELRFKGPAAVKEFQCVLRKIKCVSYVESPSLHEFIAADFDTNK